tara:strand:- start:818 stop:2236 length:1419 start_codon:yes stop_codon:yes gene_type:complete
VNLTKFYINGEFVDPSSKETLEIINPATEEKIGIVALGSTSDVDKAVYSARKAFNVSSKLSKKDRLDILETIRENYKKRYKDISEAIRLEMGAPVKLAEGSQAATGLGHLKTAMRVLEKHEFEYRHEDYIVREEPIGVCGLITPWNWPINQIVSKFAPAFAAGCTVVLKPSEIAPLSAMIIAEIIHESQIPPGMFNLINGLGNVVGEAMSSHKDIDMMSFTGSTRGGVAVAKASAINVKRVSQELGGKSPNLILDDNSFATSITNGVIHVMGNSGQSCNAPTRMLVPRSRHDEALKIAKSALEKINVGDPIDVNSDLGPLVSKNQFDKVQKLIKKGIEEGANLVAGGTGRPNGYEKGFYARPTIFGNVSNQMVIAKEEIFGPVLAIIPYDNLDEAISIANDTIYGLAAYVTGEDREKCLEISRELRAGQISINYGSSGPSAPFGGYKQSGNGREKAEWGLTEFLEVKAIMSG